MDPRSISIEHPKIASLAPTWASFGGWSLIFEPFGYSGSNGEFFRSLQNVFDIPRRQKWLEEYGFCPLPEATYHVTFLDLVNELSFRQVDVEHADELKNVLGWGKGGIPPGMKFIGDISQELSSGMTTIRMEFDQITSFGGRVCALKLRSDSELTRAFLNVIREKGSLALEKTLGIPVKKWEPHLTLGYFANKACASKAEEEMALLQKELQQCLQGLTLQYSQFGLYKFTDMASFTKTWPLY